MGERIPDGDETEVAPEPSEEIGDSAVTQEAGPATTPMPARADGRTRRFEPGTVLVERYRIVRRLGKGGMGEVFLADDLKLSQKVALKFLPRGVESDREKLQLLFDEVRVARQISHANACRVFDLGEAEGVHFLSMEYIDGEDLLSLLARIGRLPWEKAVELGRQTCEGLAAAHDAGILHRDLKPANLMIDGQGQAKITDFGLAALSDSISGAAIRSGTPAYMAPEQLAGTAVSVQSDLYALGLLLYELFTGRRAFEASSMAELLQMQEQPPKPPSAWVESFDPVVDRIIVQCLERDPNARPASAREIAEALSGPVELEQGTQVRTLLMSRLEDSARLLETQGDRASAELFSAHDALARDLVEQHGGREIDKSDGFLVLFERPWQAVRYALSYHRMVSEEASERGVELSARVAIHLGEVVVRRSTRQEISRGARPVEVEGLAKPTTARLCSLARPRQTLLTGAAFDLARRGAVGETEDSERLSWLAHGEYQFAGSEEAVGVFEVGTGAVAPLEAPEEPSVAKRIEAENTILGWRPALGLKIPYRPNWTVKEKLGEGGFGEVWLGEHRKTGEERVYKFCYEAERLQSLQREITVFRLLKEEIGLRDDIARILDWNLDQSPYFVEFVHLEGGSLVDWADGRGGISAVPIAERLELVAQVATALAAAHSVGVLHKDIKPGNVLMAVQSDGTPQAVLTDFGIGLVTDTQRLAAKGITVLGLTERDGSTPGASTTGTHLYMAPELLAGKPSTIQADIYSLGVLLYQVAVGELERPLAPGWERHIDDEMLREDIAACVDGTPSRRPGNADVVAERLRSLDERRAAREAEELAAQAAARAQRRRKLLTTVAAVSSVFLVVVSVLAIQAIKARSDADRRRGQAEQLIDFMLNDLHEGLDKIGRLDLLEGVARTSRDYFDTLSERDESPDALFKRGVTLTHIGDVLLDRGDAEQALATQRSAVALFEDALEGEPGNADWRRGVVRSRLRLGDVLVQRREMPAARRVFEAAAAEAQELTRSDPASAHHRFALALSRFSIASLDERVGESARALEGFTEVSQMMAELLEGTGSREWRYSLLHLDARIGIAGILKFRNERAEAAKEFDRALLLVQELVEADPANATWTRRLALIHYNQGFAQYDDEKFDAALASFEASGKAYRVLARTDEARVEWRARVAESLRMIGRMRKKAGDPAGALELYREALPILEEVSSDDPTRVDWLHWLARLRHSIGSSLRELGDTEGAVESYEVAVGLRKRMVEISPDDQRLQNQLAATLITLGTVYSEQRQEVSARAQWEQAHEILERLTADSDLTMYRQNFAEVLIRLDRMDEALPIVRDLRGRGEYDPMYDELLREKGIAGN